MRVGFIKKVGCEFVPEGPHSGIYIGAGKSKCLRGKMMGSRESKGESEHDSLSQPTEMGLIRVESTF